ncbi:MAG: PD-(D/E)XK nuclease family protein [Candidatus Peribacteraceae bacterium]|nr:PD-(D/E)XK nuclease family protein [Candidatus Peribacteraceae bacterium]
MPLSYSQLAMYRRCPRQYEFAVRKKLPWGISPAESFGASVHNALKKWGELERASSGKLQASSGQQELFAAEKKGEEIELTEETLLKIWSGCFSPEAFATRLEADFARARGETLLQQFYAWWARERRRVVAVEKSFSIALDGFKLTGRLDRVEQIDGGVAIIDFKTGELKEQDAVDSDLQLSVYALAAKELFDTPCHGLTLLFLNEDEVIERTTQRSEGQLKDAVRQMHALAERIESADFHPTPGKAVCRYCPYRGVCDMAAV